MTNAEILEKYLPDEIGGAVNIGVDIVEMMIKQDKEKDPIHAAGGCYCRECKHYMPYCGSNCCDIFCDGQEDPYPTLPNDYCSYGEREDGK